MASKEDGLDRRVKSKDVLGNTYIPATQRPDGTWRKPVKVKDGYVPTDERPRYQCRAQLEAASTRSKYPVGYSPRELQNKANAIIEQRKQKERQSDNSSHEASSSTNIVPKSAPITPQDHLQKKIHTVQKKINEIDRLKERIDNGELAEPEKTQLQKLERRPQLQNEIDDLTEQLKKLDAADAK